MSDTPEPPVIDLTICWYWYCPHCALKNYHNGCKIKPTDLQEIKDGLASNGLSDDQLDLVMGEVTANDFVVTPSVVFCSRCETKYAVRSDPAV